MATLNINDKTNNLPLKDVVDRFLHSKYNILVWAILAIFTFIFALELVFYTVVVIYAIYVIAFSNDLSPTMPLFALCYVTVSVGNNPGSSEEGVFYGTSAIYIICLAISVIIALILKISLDKKLGWKLFLTKRRHLLLGIGVLIFAYLLSGIGNKHYFEVVLNNLVFALIQGLAILLLYFVYSATIDWEKFNVDYFAYIELITGFVVVFQLLWIYCTRGVIIDGVIDRGKILTGWGVYNNIGAMITIAIPFAFYFACTKKRSGIYLVLAVLLLIGVMFSCSRGSIVFALISFIISYVYAFIKAKNKKEFKITSLIILGVLVIGCLTFYNLINKAFIKIPIIVDFVDGNLIFNDSGRLEIYREGIKAFFNNPIFGQSFYSLDYDLSDFSNVDSFSAFFPPRWHNTFIQILASCGLIGFGAYLYHRYQTVRLFIKKRNTKTTFIAISIVTLLCLSLIDCHFFNVGPALVYSMALAVIEYSKVNEN